MLRIDKSDFLCFLASAAVFGTLIVLGLGAFGYLDIGLASQQIMSILLWITSGALGLVSIFFLVWSIQERDGLFAGIALICLVLCVFAAFAALHIEQVLDFFYRVIFPSR